MIFSPNVLYTFPCIERILITLLVNLFDGNRSSTGSWAEIMNCSLRTNCKNPSAQLLSTRLKTHQHPDDRVVVWVADVVGEVLNDIEKTPDEIVFHQNCPLNHFVSIWLSATTAYHTQKRHPPRSSILTFCILNISYNKSIRSRWRPSPPFISPLRSF